jgi:acetyl esterase
MKNVDPRLRPLMELALASPPRLGMSVSETRNMANQRSQTLIASCYRAPRPVARVEQVAMPVAGGEIELRVYYPEGDGARPAHLYLHGGGFWLGSIDSSDGPARETCVRAGVVVVSVGYRLAPEHPFPIAPEDCFAALCFVAENAAELGIDGRRLSIGGDSAGGNLAAVVALMTRDRNGPEIALQVLGFPVTDLTMSQPSVHELANGYLLTRAGMEEYRTHYLADPAQMTNPYASPLLAGDLSGVAPALVMTMEFDPLRDEGEALARRLIEAGVPTTHHRWLGHIHGSTLFTRLLAEDGDAYHQTIATALSRAHAESHATL